MYSLGIKVGTFFNGVTGHFRHLQIKKEVEKDLSSNEFIEFWSGLNNETFIDISDAQMQCDILVMDLTDFDPRAFIGLKHSLAKFQNAKSLVFMLDIGITSKVGLHDTLVSMNVIKDTDKIFTYDYTISEGSFKFIGHNFNSIIKDAMEQRFRDLC